jgi:DNA polymerase-3 subunit gamma/tau
MSHAQRLIPIEQLLSDVAGTQASPAQRPQSRPAIVSAPSAETRRPEPPAARPNFVSPFAADSARKGTPRQEASSDSAPTPGPRIVAAASQPEPVIMGSAAPAPMRDSAPEPTTHLVPHVDEDAGPREVTASASPSAPRPSPPQPRSQPELQSQPAPAATTADSQLDRLQAAVLQALTDGNQRILVSMLSAGEWSVQGNEVVIKISESQTVVDMSLGPDAKRLAIASASGVLGRAVKLKVVPGSTVAPQDVKRESAIRSNGPTVGGRGRAEQDPVVQRMREKFGAEIRTVIDYKERR